MKIFGFTQKSHTNAKLIIKIKQIKEKAVRIHQGQSECVSVGQMLF